METDTLTKPMKGITMPTALADIVSIPLDQIVPGNNDRQTFDEAKLQELASSMERIGQLQPVVVRRKPGHRKYELIAGERRWRAAQLAGLDNVSAIVRRRLEEAEVAAIMLAENNARVDLNPVEEAEAFQKSMDYGVSVEDIAAETGCTPSYIRSRVTLLALCPEARHLVATGQITAGYATPLAQLDSNRQLLAIRALDAAGGVMPQLQFRTMCDLMLAEQQAEPLFDSESFLRVDEYVATSKKLHLPNRKELIATIEALHEALTAACPDDPTLTKSADVLQRLDPQTRAVSLS